MSRKKVIQSLQNEDVEEAMAKKQKDYLSSLSAGLQLQHVDRYVKEAEGVLSTAITMGRLNVAENCKDTASLLTRIELTEDERSQMEQKAKREEVERKVKYLSQQLRINNNELKVRVEAHSPLQHSSLAAENNDILSKSQHQAVIKKIKTEKKARKQRNRQLVALLQKQRVEEEGRKRSMEQLQRQSSLQRKKKQLQKSMIKRQQEHNQFIRQEKQLQKEYEQVKRRKFLYEKLQQRYVSNVVLPGQEEQKRKLRQIHEFKEKYNLEAAMSHEKEYMSARKTRQSRQTNNQYSQRKYHPPERTEKLARLLLEEEEAQTRKLHEKREQVQEKIRRQEQYMVMVKSQRMPRISSLKQKEVQQRLQLELNKKNKPEIDQRQIGINYLQFSKQMRKVESMGNETPSTLPYDSKSYITQLKAMPLQRRSLEQFEELRRRRLIKIQGSDGSRTEKLMKLDAQAKKIQERLRQKEEAMKYGVGRQQTAQNETAELVLSSIRAKMGIMHVLKT